VAAFGSFAVACPTTCAPSIAATRSAAPQGQPTAVAADTPPLPEARAGAPPAVDAQSAKPIAERRAIIVAALPAQPIRKSMASPGMCSYIVIAKYMDGLPLYRPEGIPAHSGFDISLAAMAAWMIRLGQLVVPLMNLMDEILCGDAARPSSASRFGWPVSAEANTCAASPFSMRSRGRPDAPSVVSTLTPGVTASNAAVTSAIAAFRLPGVEAERFGVCCQWHQHQAHCEKGGEGCAGCATHD
jgi:hypothetical protein